MTNHFSQSTFFCCSEEFPGIKKRMTEGSGRAGLRFMRLNDLQSQTL